MAFRRVRKNVKRSRRARKSVRRTRRVARRVSPLRTMVRREIAKTEEVKSIQYGRPLGSPVNFSTVDASNFSSQAIVVCTPGTASGQDITQGTGFANRIGNKVRTKKLVLTMMFWPAPFNAVTNPVPSPTEVGLWLIKLKPTLNDNVTTVNTICQGSFLQAQNSNIGLWGTVEDLMTPINKDSVQLLGFKKLKIGYSAYGNAGTNANTQHYHNNDYNYNQKVVWDLTKHVDKNLIWDDSATEPTNRHIYLVMQALRADGSANGGTVTDTCTSMYRFDYDYTDA